MESPTRALASCKFKLNLNQILSSSCLTSEVSVQEAKVRSLGNWMRQNGQSTPSGPGDFLEGPSHPGSLPLFPARRVPSAAAESLWVTLEESTLIARQGIPLDVPVV